MPARCHDRARATILPCALAALLLPTAALAAAKSAPAAAAESAPAAEDPAALKALLSDAAGDGPVIAGERLSLAARKGGLTPALAALAAELLRSDDTFARALAEWAIDAKVQRDNTGQAVAWPRQDPPEWYKTRSAVPPESYLEMDYVRQAVALGIHRDGKALAASADAMVRRARAVMAEIERAGAPPEARAAVARQLAALEGVRDRLAARLAAAPQDIAGLRRLWLDARLAARPIVLANPAVDFSQVAFVAGYPGHSLMNITGSQYPWTHKPGGDICIKTGLDPAAPVRGVIAGRLGPGHVHGIDLWWAADRFVFGFARQPNWPPRFDTENGMKSFELRTDQPPTHIFEVMADGTGLRQVTDHAVWSDFEPTYCASGDIVFASDRSGRSSECGRFASDHTVINLYVVSSDGRRIRRLSDNKDIDRYPHCLANGLIAYTRWDYQERHFFEIHSIWTVRPDGTMADALFKQHLRAPYGLRDVRSVPGGQKLVAVGTGHHTLAYGPVMLIDPTQGVNAQAGIRIVTPDCVPQEGPTGGAPVPEGGVRDGGGVWHSPWALSETAFLGAYSYEGRGAGEAGKKAAGFAIYFIDVYGNKELIHRDPVLSCSFPMPLRKRPRPPITPDSTDPARPYATAYVTDVYEGLRGVPRGTIKYLRIAQHVGWPLDEKIGGMRWIPGNAFEWQFGFWSWSPVRVIGTVAVESDGSAHFKAPADAAVYFQALDEHFMEVRRMRSHVTFQPGEVRGCRGCHETQDLAPAGYAAEAALALRRPPQTPAPPPWGATRLLGYEWLVQPVLDRNCVRCHDTNHPKGLDLTAARGPDGFYQSFRTMFGVPPGRAADPKRDKAARALVSVADRFSGAGVSQPMEFGSYKSPLVQHLLKDERHRREVKLPDSDWQALVTWIDANAPYYDTFFNKRPAGGGPPRRGVRLELPDPFAAIREPPQAHVAVLAE